MGYSGCTSIVDLEFGSLFLYNMNKQGPVDYECKTRKQTYTGLIGGTILRQAEIFLESGFLALVSHISLPVRLSVLYVKVGCLIIVWHRII